MIRSIKNNRIIFILLLLCKQALYKDVLMTYYINGRGIVIYHFVFKLGESIMKKVLINWDKVDILCLLMRIIVGLL